MINKIVRNQSTIKYLAKDINFNSINILLMRSE